MIEKDGNLLTELRLIHVTGVSLIGNVQITTQALHAVLQAGVDISFFSGSGRYLFDIEEGCVRLMAEAFKQFCSAYEKWMQAPISQDMPQNFRDVIRQQADILKQAVREQKTYQPFEWKGAGEQTECI